MTTTLGIDLHGGDVQSAPLQVGLAKANGVAFIYAKATQGMTFVDPAYHTIRTQCATVGGILFGAYHFFQPGEDPIEQARFFVKRATPVSGIFGLCSMLSQTMVRIQIRTQRMYAQLK